MVMRLKPKEHEEDMKEDKKQQELAIWDCGSPLYDSYELVSLSHLIERHFMILPFSLGGSKRFIAQFSRPCEAGPAMTRSSAGPAKAVAGLSRFLDMKMLKRIVFWEGKEKKSKKIKAKKNYGFYSKFVPWRK